MMKPGFPFRFVLFLTIVMTFLEGSPEFFNFI